MSYLKKFTQKSPAPPPLPASLTKNTPNYINSSNNAIPPSSSAATTGGRREVEDEEEEEISITTPKEMNFRGLKLNNYSMHSMISTLAGNSTYSTTNPAFFNTGGGGGGGGVVIEAIDFSHNRIEDLPHSLPRSILGLNLSYNKIQKFSHLGSNSIAKELNHLIEINLSHNHISK